MHDSNLFMSTCSRRDLARRRALGRPRRGRHLRRRGIGGRSRLLRTLQAGGVDLLIATTVVAGAAAYVIGRGGI